MDHIHYARWLTVHVIDLLQLQSQCPDIYKEFIRGRFVTQKTSHKFSCLAHDQIHEQQNVIAKGDAGIIGISENEAALKRWMVSGPEIGRMRTEYEVKCTKKKQPIVIFIMSRYQAQRNCLFFPIQRALLMQLRKWETHFQMTVQTW